MSQPSSNTQPSEQPLSQVPDGAPSVPRYLGSWFWESFWEVLLSLTLLVLWVSTKTGQLRLQAKSLCPHQRQHLSPSKKITLRGGGETGSWEKP